MLADALLPHLAGMQIEAISSADEAITLEVACSGPEARCPGCAGPSVSVNSQPALQPDLTDLR